MIPVDEARALVTSHCLALEPVGMSLADAVGRVVAEDLTAPCDIPAFPQSGMDGYAFAHADIPGPLTIVGEQPAGGRNNFQLQPGEAIRIFTGAAVPPGADTVLMQEKALVADGRLRADDANLAKGTNVRPLGSEITQGSLALAQGERLTPAAVGFLAGIGIDRVRVYPPPRVAFLVTGDELQEPGKPLAYGQVYESNARQLRSAIALMHIREVEVYACPDDPAVLTSRLSEAVDRNDIVLVTGGVSVGDHDHTLQAFQESGVRPLFHRVRQKPGKPLLFGMRGPRPVFGLPGNPASVLTCFYQYVCPALASMMRLPSPVRRVQAELVNAYRKPAGLTHFLKAEVADGRVRLLDGQESYRLRSFARANALAVVPEASTSLEPGTRIWADLLPE
jgi:molybdopterin molybdotransferase